MRLHSYVVRYDSGFAPNPFFGLATLATCKPDIRKNACVGEYILGTGSADRRIGQGGRLVHLMRVSETLTFQEFWNDERFANKRPTLARSRMHACGDNIYQQNANGLWNQIDSYHSNADGTPNQDHISRDTGVNRILVSNEFVYFGGEGPKIPDEFRNFDGIDICMAGRGRKIIETDKLINEFIEWAHSLGRNGYAGRPLDWLK